MNKNYDDIINLPHYVSKKHPQMSIEARSAQFAPFSALTGYDEALKETAIAIGLSASEVESMLNLGSDSLDAAYKVLEIEPSATDDEVKAAYRKLALKHHPDRVTSLGEDIRKAAEDKFRQINEAKDRIYKARGIN